MIQRRRPTWRCDLATEYAKKHGYKFKSIKFPKDEDKLVKKLTEYFCKALPGKVMSRELELEYPYLNEAFKMHLARSGYSESWMLEALVMADLSDKEVASYIFADAKLVQTFCLCFFDLRDKATKARYSNNVRLICESRANVIYADYWWKYWGLRKGAEFLIKTVFDREKMGEQELDELFEDQRKQKALNASWALEKRGILADEVRTEAEVMTEKQDIDIQMASVKDRHEAQDAGDIGKRIVNVLTLASEQVKLVEPNKNVSAEEPRLITKKEK